MVQNANFSIRSTGQVETPPFCTIKVSGRTPNILEILRLCLFINRVYDTTSPRKKTNEKAISRFIACDCGRLALDPMYIWPSITTQQDARWQTKINYK